MTETIKPFRRGTAAGRGEFTLDEAKAREKMREYQLVNPNYYILEFIKVAHLLEATEISIDIDADEMEMRFDGAVLTAGHLDQLHSAPFAKRVEASAQALRHLAIGVHGAQGLGLGELLIEVGGEHAATYRLVGEEVQRVEVLVRSPVLSGTRIYLRERLRAGHLLRFVNSVRGRLPKVVILKERCGFARIPIIVNGDRINREIVLPEETLAPITFDKGSERGWLGITLSHKIIKTFVVHHGVLVSIDERIGPYIGGWAIVDAPKLTLNLSQSAFIEDEAWDAIQASINDGMQSSLQTYLSEMRDEELTAARELILKAVIPILLDMEEDAHHQEALSSRSKKRLTGSKARFLKTLETLALFTSATGSDPGDEDRFWSIADARSSDAGRTRIMYATRSFRAGIPHQGGRPVLVVPIGFQECGPFIFGHFADECVDMTEPLRPLELRIERRLAEHSRSEQASLAAARRAESQRHWRWEGMKWPEKPAVRHSQEIQLTGRVEGLDVSVTWSPDRYYVEVCYVMEGRLLGRRIAADLASTGLSIYVSGDFDLLEGRPIARVNARLRAAWSHIRPLLAHTISVLPQGARLDVMRSIVEGRLYAGLNELAGFEVWTVGQAPLDALGPLADQQLFQDTHARLWSLRTLDEALRAGELRQILYHADGVKFVEGERLDDEFVIVLDPDESVETGPTAAIFNVLFGWFASTAMRFLVESKREPSSPPAKKERVTPRAGPTTADRQLVASLRAQLAAVDPFHARSEECLSALEVNRAAEFADAELRPSKAVLNGGHLAIKHALAYPDDPVALAFVSSTIHHLLSAEYYGSSRGHDAMAFLDDLSALLDEGAPTHRFASDVQESAGISKVEVDRPGEQETPGPALAAGSLHRVPSQSSGPANAPITICHFSAFGCFTSTRELDTVREIVADYPDMVRVVHKNFPRRDRFNRNSEPGARAALAAGEQGKFWEMHDLLHEHEPRFGEHGLFGSLGVELGLDMSKFWADMESPEIAERIKVEHLEGCRMGVLEAPAIFINGVRAIGPPSWANGSKPPTFPVPPLRRLKEIIDAQLEAEGAHNKAVQEHD